MLPHLKNRAIIRSKTLENKNARNYSGRVFTCDV